VFWSGDLNYRIDRARSDVISLVERGEYEALWSSDQLIRQMADNALFGLRGFTEAPLSFAPTFKYDRGSMSYDSSEKMRVPAYCDRILFKGGNVVQRCFKRIECKISDHRPLFAEFTLQVFETNGKVTDTYAGSNYRRGKVRACGEDRIGFGRCVAAEPRSCASTAVGEQCI
jgi:hypothetical protein